MATQGADAKQQQEMVTKDEARYRNAGLGERRRCANCSMFRGPHGCTLVKGSISPAGVCKYFAPKKGSGGS